jgi:uncharacterized membrane protein YhaH (DUF805 family)
MFSSLFGFSGRIGRGGWWFSQLIGLLIIGAWVGVAVAFGDPNQTPDTSGGGVYLVMFILSVLVICVINICATVKRYHDRGKNGFWIFISLVPFIGGIWQLIECGMLPGDDGDNDYGPPPGAEKRMGELGREVSSMASGNLSKLDDNYLAEYARKIALEQANQQSANASNFGQNTNARPVFGKR